MRRSIIRLSLERLEDRWAPAVRTWTGGGLNDLWSNPANWDGGVPAGGDDVIIPATLDSSEVVFDNTVPGGAVSLSNLSSDEPFRVTAAPASSATLTLDGPGAFSFNSTLTISAGALNGGATVAVNGSLTLTGGTLGGTGTLNVGGLLTWSGGVMSGTGVTNASGGLIMTGSLSLSGGRRLNNAGAATYNGVASNSFSISGSVFNNLAGATFTLDGNNGFIAGAFNNLGTFIKRAGPSGGGVTRFFLTAFHNSGAVELQSGTLSLEGNGTHTGDFATAAGTTLQFGGSGLNTFSAGANVTVAGLMRQASNEFSGTSFQAGSSYTVSGATEIISGNLIFDITVNAPTLVLSGGRLAGTGTFNVSGLITWSGGAMAGAGVTNADGGLIMTGQLALTGRTLNNAGAATYNGVANNSFSNGGTINNLATGTFTIVGNNNIAPSVFNNLGTLIKQAGTGGDGVTTFASLRNSGSFELQSGTLFSDPGATNTGAVTIGSSGTFITVGYRQDAGNTTVVGGAIRATGNPGVDINGGSLTGWGTINAKVRNAGGQVSPGLSPGSIGSFAINGQYDQGAAGTLNIEIGGPSAATQFDQLHVVGAASDFGVGAGGTLNISLIGGFSPNVGDTFMIINNDGPFAVAGAFAGLPEGAMFMVGETLFGISYVGGTGNDIVLTALTAANTPPSNIVLDLNAAVDEAGTATLSGSFTDPDAGDTHTVVIDWGTGEAATTLNLAAGVTTFSVSHTYLDDNPAGTSFDVYTVSAAVTEPTGGAATGSTDIIVNNVSPTAVNDSAVTSEDQPVVIAVLANDSDPAGPLDPLRIDSVTNGSKGTVAIDTKGTTDTTDDEIVYTPNPGAVGSDSFTYTTSDGDGGVATATISVQIQNALDLSGRVFDDKDNDGLYEPADGDAGLQGVAVQLVNETSGVVIASQATAADGTYFFDVNVGAGTYKIVAAQPAGFLDGRETAGNLGGTVVNTQDSNEITGISVGAPGATADAIDYLFADIGPSQLLGLVWSDASNDGEVDFGETVIPGVAIELTGLDDRGQAVSRAVATASGVYAFLDLRPSDAAGYTIREIQPSGYADGLDIPGTVNGVAAGNNAANDVFSGVVLPRPSSLAEDYNFGERPPAEGGVSVGQTATIGYWQNKNGQELIRSLNGGSTATQLGDWLAAKFPNMYGAFAGANNLAGKTNADVAAFYKVLFARTARTAAGGGPSKMDAQVMATALAVYVTNQALAGTTAAAYGFLVTANGVGTRTFSAGTAGAAFGLTDNAEVTVLDLLLAVDARSKNGLLYDLDGDGEANDPLETSYRTMANDVFSGINEAGDI